MQMPSLVMIVLPTTFPMNLVGVWQSPHTRRFLKIRSGVLGGVLMSPNAMDNESHCGDTNEQPFLHPLRHTNLVSGTYPDSSIR